MRRQEARQDGHCSLSTTVIISIIIRTNNTRQPAVRICRVGGQGQGEDVGAVEGGRGAAGEGGGGGGAVGAAAGEEVVGGGEEEGGAEAVVGVDFVGSWGVHFFRVC